MTWKIALFLVVWGVLLTPAALVISSGTEERGTALGPLTRLSAELIGLVAVVLAALALTRFVDRRSFRSLGFAAGSATRDLVIGLLLGAVLILLAVVALWPAGWAKPVPAVGFSWRALGVMAAALLLNSATQEILVRGYVLQTIEADFSTPMALIGSSLFFVLLHAGAIAEAGALPAVNLFGAGLLLGVAYTTTRNLWLPVALHFSWNFLQGPVLGIAVSGQALGGGWRMVELEGPAIVTGGRFGLEGGLAATGVTVLGIVLLTVGRRRSAQRSEPSACL